MPPGLEETRRRHKRLVLGNPDSDVLEMSSKHMEMEGNTVKKSDRWRTGANTGEDPLVAWRALYPGAMAGLSPMESWVVESISGGAGKVTKNA